jgi:hypothetical protein
MWKNSEENWLLAGAEQHNQQDLPIAFQSYNPKVISSS